MAQLNYNPVHLDQIAQIVAFIPDVQVDPAEDQANHPGGFLVMCATDERGKRLEGWMRQAKRRLVAAGWVVDLVDCHKTFIDEGDYFLIVTPPPPERITL